MSDYSSPPRTSTRGTTERRAALDQRKNAQSTRSKRPTFLGAEDDDNDTFDFEAFSRPSATRARKERDDGNRTGTGETLGNGFDDLFNLDGPGTTGGEDPDEALKGDLGELDADAVPAKKRRIVAKMDETRLLGPSGFPKLMQDIKRVRLKGKGHEAQDLKRVLSLYQLWTHQMYPKTNLRDTLTTVEKLCHKRSAQRALKTYKDEWKNGKSTSTSAHPEFDADPETLARLQQEAEDAEEGEETGIFAGLNKRGSQSQSQSQSKEKGKGKEKANEVEEDTFDQAELDDLFGDDDDALMASLEAEALGRGGGAVAASSRKSEAS
ncbi:Csm3p [Sporobolomyces salmoneus]|uniref:Csm3p n=1 Tax=Sporobolomyces salmoneus TaxID=183962 RepID=UPI003174B65E